jgi:hypothetical protein
VVFGVGLLYGSLYGDIGERLGLLILLSAGEEVWLLDSDIVMVDAEL